MANTEGIESYCRNCVSRDFVMGRGLVCKRTGTLPDFEDACENFQKDEELEKIAPTPDPEIFSAVLSREQLLAEENLPKAVLWGTGACLLGAVAWGLVSVSTGYQIGYMAIGIGFIVGLAMRRGKGVRPVFGIIGAALALLSCILGDFCSIIGYVAKEYSLSYMEALAETDFKAVFSVMAENIVSATALFYGIALYEGYKLSFRVQKQPESGKI